MSKFLSLSFVTKRPGRGKGLNFWSVTPEEAYAKQWRQGELIALDALAFMANDGPPRGDLLLQVALDMPRRDDCTGVEFGFMRTIGDFAALARREFGDVFFLKHMAEVDAGSERRLARMAAERSERAKRGTLTRRANKAKRKRAKRA